MAGLEFAQPPAVVVGVCGHGLALIRALHAGQVPVVAVEASRTLPGVRTRLATLAAVDDINGPGLIDALLSLRKRIDCPGRPVLFLTNDTMVRTVGEHWDSLDGLYSLSWGDARHALLPLLEKSALEQRCREVGLDYPRTFVLRSADDVDAAVHALDFPIIVKPARPLSRFKTAQPDTPAALRALAERFSGDLPFLVQQFIPGDDTHIHFSALYLAQGRPLARFDGHKLRSRPLGHTSIAESSPNDVVYAQTCRFFDGLSLSGPASLELKRDDAGRFWVIEPTLGRTDFWIGLCVVNGVNLPLVEYQHQCGLEPPAPQQQDQVVWFNEDRDPSGRLWMARPARMRGRASAFVFLNRQDPAPARAFVRQVGANLLRSAARRLRLPGSAGRSPASAACEALAGFQGLKQRPSWAQLRETSASIFETPEWFDNLATTCSMPGSSTLVLTVDSPAGCTVLPVRRSWGRRVESLSNYYASLYGPATTAPHLTREHASAFAEWFAAARTSTLQLHPVDAGSPFWQSFAEALRQRGYWVDRYFAFANWHHPCAGTDWASYLASRPSRLRNTISRTLRKLQADRSFDIRVLDAQTSAADMQRAVAEFQTVYAHSWKKQEPHPSFIGSFCRLAHANGWLRIGLCHLDGQPVAAQIWLVKDGVASIFKLAYDERYAKRGVGTVVSAAMSEHVLDVDRVSEIDFLAGDDAYKAEWMGCRRERHGIVAFHPGTITGLVLAAKHFGARLLRRSWPTARPAVGALHRP